MKHIRLPFPAVFAINALTIALGKHYDDNWILTVGIIIVLLEICILLLANPIDEANKWLRFKLGRLDIKLRRNPNKKPKYDQSEKEYCEKANRRVRTLQPYTTSLNITIVFGTAFNMFLCLIHITS